MAIYTAENTALGKIGPCDVFVNGNKIYNAFFADTEKGIVRYYPDPCRIKKGADYLYSRKLTGTVSVVSKRSGEINPQCQA